MREIKFRAWDKKNKEMLLPDGNGYFSSENHLGFVIDGNGEPIYLDDLNTPEDIVFMRYTVRKDIDRKEVYEGDVLNDNILPGIIGSQGYIKWCDEDSCFLFMPTFDSDPNLCLKHGKLLSEVAIHDMRIIDNIHENPELLEKNNG